MFFDERDRIHPRVSLRAALRKDIARTAGGKVAAAACVGLGGAQQIDNVTAESKRGYLVAADGVTRYRSACASMSLDQYELLLEHTGAVVSAHAVAEIAGGYFMPGVEVADVDDVCLLREMSTVVVQLGELTSCISHAISDGVVSEREWRDVTENKRALVGAVARLVSLAAAMRG